MDIITQWAKESVGSYVQINGPYLIPVLGFVEVTHLSPLGTRISVVFSILSSVEANESSHLCMYISFFPISDSKQWTGLLLFEPIQEIINSAREELQ